MTQTELAEEAFWNKVWFPSCEEDRWLWTGTCQSDGYGQFRVDGGRVGAHRFAYQSEVGPISNGLTIDHLCRTRNCVNPSHMEAVTLKENILRGTGRGALHARQTACIYGHEFTEKNTYLHPNGSRRCRACRRRRWHDRGN